MNSLEVKRLDEEINVQAHPDNGVASSSPSGLLKRFFNWVLDEVAPPADEPYEDWADRQW